MFFIAIAGELASLLLYFATSAINTQFHFGQVFRTYGEYIDEMGLSLAGLTQTYDDGAGDVNRDFTALGIPKYQNLRQKEFFPGRHGLTSLFLLLLRFYIQAFKYLQRETRRIWMTQILVT